VDSQLARAGAEQVAGDADVVAQVEQFIEREALLAPLRPGAHKSAAVGRPAEASQSPAFLGHE